MGITFRNTKGSALTHTELDNNFREFFYSASVGDGSITLFKSQSLDPGVTYTIRSVPFSQTGSHYSTTNNIKITGSFDVLGEISATSYNNIYVSSSTVYKSGSTKFGDSSDDTHEFTGSFGILGASSLDGTLNVTGGITGSFSGDGSGLYNVGAGGIFTETGSVQSTTNTVQITGSLTVSGSLGTNNYTLPLADGTDGQVIMTDGAGSLVYNDVVKYVNVKNVASATLVKGTPIHVTGATGNTPEIIAASASLASTMPATFVLNEDLAPTAEGRAILSGYINGVNTSGFTEGDIVYVAADGGYTNVKPTGSNLIQNLGVVTKVDVTNGSGYIYGSGRSAATPNLLTGEVFFGVADASVATSLSDILSGSSYIYSGSFSGSFAGDGSGLTGVGGSGIFTATGSFYSTTNDLQITGSLETTGDVTVGGTLTEISALRFKENIIDYDHGLQEVNQMRPVRYIKRGSSLEEVGVIAEEVESILPEFVLKDPTGDPYSVAYPRLTVVLVNAVKELYQIVQTQQEEIDRLKNN